MPSNPPLRSLRLADISLRPRDDVLRSELMRVFRRFGKLQVNTSHIINHERIAYIHFKYPEDATKAFRSLPPKFILFDQPVRVTMAAGEYVEPSSSYYGEDRSRFRGDHSHHSGDRRSTRSDEHSGNSRHSAGSGYTEHRGGRAYNDHHRDKPPEDDPRATRTLFVGQLSSNVDGDYLRQIFLKYGPVEEVDLKLSADGKNFAFVTFSNLDYAYKAKLAMDGRKIRAHQCRIGYGRPIKSNCIWVGGLGPGANLELLEREFDRFGVIKKIHWPQGKSYAYILFENADAAIAACNGMRGFLIDTKRIRTDFVNEEQVFGTDGLSTVDETKIAEAASTASVQATKRPGDEQNGDVASKRSRLSVTLPDPTRLACAESVAELAKVCPPAWIGSLCVKGNAFVTQLHMVGGEPSVARLLTETAETTPLRITQRLRLDPNKLEEVTRRITTAGEGGHCVLIGFTCSTSDDDITKKDSTLQHRPLKNLIVYLKQKEAAGVISLSRGSDSKVTGVMHVFPPFQYAHEAILKFSPQVKFDAQPKDDYLIALVVNSERL